MGLRKYKTEHQEWWEDEYGMIQGRFIDYSKDGCRTVAEYVDGNMNGGRFIFDSTGILRDYDVFKDHCSDGECVSFGVDGKVRSYCNIYSSGFHGESVVFGPDGKVESYILYDQDKPVIKLNELPVLTEEDKIFHKLKYPGIVYVPDSIREHRIYVPEGTADAGK